MIIQLDTRLFMHCAEVDTQLNLIVQHPCIVLQHYACLQSLREKIPTLTLLNKLGSKKNTRSDGADEAGISKHFLASLNSL